MKRRIKVEKGLSYEDDDTPHCSIVIGPAKLQGTSELRSRLLAFKSPDHAAEVKTGIHVPFKQVRLVGQVNPLNPPLHVETVLIGRALGQQTGYFHGVGFRVFFDGRVEGEFLHGTEMFDRYQQFETFVISCLQRGHETNG
jgi:hypothetical protein